MAKRTKKKIKPVDNEANMPNPNKGTKGTNRQYSQVHGNRGKQMQPERKQKKEK
ncbi:hypothetical protein [Maridesulfovibrio sp.]|uniref:hypothetical protein n=1 Tax=Maridesulfovibrio sp. TaxID=2795000 RepID=UPI002AA92E0F|nr:hypothetical protein [Maridesulfovibrio sp.]